MLNHVYLIGSLEEDPKWIRSKDGHCIARMRIATVTRRSKGQSHVDVHTVVAFDAVAQSCLDKLAKSSHVYVEGFLHYHKWTDAGVSKQDAEIRANRVEFLVPFQVQ